MGGVTLRVGIEVIPGKGIMIAREFDKTDHTVRLEDEDWYIVQTNRDVYKGYPDIRQAHAVSFMNQMSQSKVTLDGQNIIQDVLFQKGVMMSITIFTAQVTAQDK